MHTLECGKRGPRCKEWEVRVDALTTELASMRVVSVDPRADAIARLAVLVGLNGDRAKAIVQAIEPAALPIFLELGAIVLLGIAFPHRKRAIVANTETIAATLAILHQVASIARPCTAEVGRLGPLPCATVGRRSFDCLALVAIVRSIRGDRSQPRGQGKGSSRLSFATTLSFSLCF